MFSFVRRNHKTVYRESLHLFGWSHREMARGIENRLFYFAFFAALFLCDDGNLFTGLAI